MSDIQRGMADRKRARADATKDWEKASPEDRRRLVQDAKDLRYSAGDYDRTYAWSILAWSTRKGEGSR